MVASSMATFAVVASPKFGLKLFTELPDLTVVLLVIVTATS